ncbi:hypothetical protein TNCV_1730151 [Trichonephila clavipes]|nr:hypothetical protein TNCV_1730151 [Trichonephila clavipes]
MLYSSVTSSLSLVFTSFKQKIDDPDLVLNDCHLFFKLREKLVFLRQDDKKYVLSHFVELRYLDDKPVAAIERISSGRKETTLMEDLMDDVQNFFHDVTNSLMVKVNRKFNSIV